MAESVVETIEHADLIILNQIETVQPVSVKRGLFILSMQFSFF